MSGEGRGVDGDTVCLEWDPVVPGTQCVSGEGPGGEGDMRSPERDPVVPGTQRVRRGTGLCWGHGVSGLGQLALALGGAPS